MQTTLDSWIKPKEEVVPKKKMKLDEYFAKEIAKDTLAPSLGPIKFHDYDKAPNNGLYPNSHQAVRSNKHTKNKNYK